MTGHGKVKALERIESVNTEFVICPYCGHNVSESDPYDFINGNGEIVTEECSNCGKRFRYSTDITINFTSWKNKSLNQSSATQEEK